MTLINYLTRIHFGDGVLEEALWAELQRNNKRNLLVIADDDHLHGDLVERLFTGFPARSSVEVFQDIPNSPTEKIAQKVSKVYRDTNRDVIIAYGTGVAIDLAKIVRVLVRHDLPLSQFSRSEGGSQLISSDLPDLYSIPGICGIASSVTGQASVTLNSGNRIEVVSKELIPTVAICDPTLTDGTSPAACASAGVTAITSCVEALLSCNYNPPAEGIAHDGLVRAIRSLHQATETNDLHARREVMAACLNGALAQQKGLGVVHAIGNSLDTVTARIIDLGALSRLVLPEVLRFYAKDAGDQFDALRHSLGFASNKNFADGLEEFLSDLPLPNRLEELGVSNKQINASANLAVQYRDSINGPRIPQVEDILSIMHAVQ